MSYAWIITRDYIADKDAKKPSNANAAGLMGPRSIGPAQAERLEAGEGHKFRMKDDDGKVYYSGRLIGDPKGQDGFGPLDDFGAPNAGCTAIEYFEDDGVWRLL